MSLNSGGAQQLTSSIGQKSKKLRKNSHIRQGEVGGSGNYSGSIINHQDQLENAKQDAAAKQQSKAAQKVRQSRKQPLMDNNEADTEETAPN